VNEYAYIICYLLGAITGVALMYIGFLLGFRSSYEIRMGKTDLPENTDKTGLFGKREKEPAEFAMLDEYDKKQKGLI